MRQAMNSETLSSLLYFVVVGGPFYWLMSKGGCGMHVHLANGPSGGHPARPGLNPTEKPPDHSPAVGAVATQSNSTQNAMERPDD